MEYPSTGTNSTNSKASKNVPFSVFMQSLSQGHWLSLLLFDCIVHGEQIDSLAPLQKKADADVNQAQSGNLAKKLIEIRLKFSAQTLADLLEQQSSGLHSTQVDLRRGKSVFTAQDDQVINNADLGRPSSTHALLKEILERATEMLFQIERRHISHPLNKHLCQVRCYSEDVC